MERFSAKEVELWRKAREIARAEYEEENGASWDEADKYKREDCVWSVFDRLKNNQEAN